MNRSTLSRCMTFPPGANLGGRSTLQFISALLFSNPSICGTFAFGCIDAFGLIFSVVQRARSEAEGFLYPAPMVIVGNVPVLYGIEEGLRSSSAAWGVEEAFRFDRCARDASVAGLITRHFQGYSTCRRAAAAFHLKRWRGSTEAAAATAAART